MRLCNMGLYKYSLVILALASFVCSVKVNMQGSLSFGKDVIDTISHYMRRNIPTRRAMDFQMNNDYVYLTVKSSFLCRELSFCEGKFETLLNGLISMLAKSVTRVIEHLIKPEPDLNKGSKHIFEGTLKTILRNIKKLLRSTNMRMSKKSEAFHWIDLLKKITAMFQEAAMAFATEKLDDNTNNKSEIKKKLMQRFVIATVAVERKYENKLCLEFNICIIHYECTKALNTLLLAFANLDNEKVKIFIQHFSEALQESRFFSHVTEGTAYEFQVILNDMGFTNTVPTKEILASLQKTVDDRLTALKENRQFIGAKDAELVNVILSDMDHFYARQKPEPFHPFLSSFFEWTRYNTKLRTSVLQVFANIADMLYKGPIELQMKLIHEVRAFLEITVDPEK